VSGPLPDGWGATTARDDSLTRTYIEAFGDFIEGLGQAVGHATARTDGFVARDSHQPSAWENSAVLLRPVVDQDDPLLDEVAAFFAPDEEHTPFLVMSATPLPSLAARGWSLMGHPPLMLRPAAPADVPSPHGLDIVAVRDADTLTAFEETMIAAFPVPEMHGRRSLETPIMNVDDYQMWVGLLDGVPVATAAAQVTSTIVHVEWISVLPSARGRGIGEAMTWKATLAAPERPAMLIASDLGQPIYERMGYLRLSRFTLWMGVRS
jgi:ribosomal protein S18 acetylase RimI-like enzyme